MDFVSLYLESEYTLITSPIRVEELVEKAKEYGYNTLAVTDLNNMYGALKFYTKCRENNIKPILGLQLELKGFVKELTKVLCYAKNIGGYKELLKLATLAKVKKDFCVADLKDLTKDVVVVVPGEENELIQAYLNGVNFEEVVNFYINNLPDIFIGLNMQTEKMRINIGKMIKNFNKYGLKCVALDKVCYLNKSDYEAYKILSSLRLGKTDYEGSEKENNSFLLKKSEALRVYNAYPELLENAVLINRMCNVEIPFSGYKMPVYDEKMDTAQYLQELSVTGLKRRLALNNIDKKDYKKYADRLFYELGVITKMGFCDYFLIVYDFIKYAKKNNILVGPGRGSAPGSLVAYSLGITELDPIKYGLLFERFLNPERVSMPDIDTDFPDYNREEVIKYMGVRYGKDKVAHIGTFGTFGPRPAIRAVAKCMQLPAMYLDEILLHVGNDVSVIEDAFENKVFKKMYDENESIKYLIDVAIKLQLLPHHVSVHAAGIIFVDSKLTDYTALQEGINGIYQTQFEASDLEKLGLVKIDFLGIRNLTIIDDVIKMIPDKSFDINKIPLDDKKVYEMLAMKDTDGVFQLESAGMRNLLAQLKTSCLEDVYNALALYRPGPMEIIPSFVKRKFGREKVEYIHEDLKEILEPTYGTIVYQEQIILIAQKFAGYTLGQADILRRAVSKKKTELMISEREKFINGSIKKGYNKELAERIFDHILKFANYGFNKSHSVAYSLVSYRMAYLKRYYPKEFMAVLMSNNIGKSRLLKSYILSCNKYGVKVFCPNINISSAHFVTKEEGMYYSLLAINGLGEVTIKSFLSERKANGLYKDYDDFIFRTKNIFNKKNVEMLIYSGALDCFGITRKSMITEYEKSIELANYGDLFKESLSEHVFSDDEYDFTLMAKYEKEALGINLKYDVFKQFSNLKAKYKTVEIANLQVDKVSNVLFVIDNYRVITTKKGEEMAFLTISDDTDTIEGVIFPKLFASVENDLRTDCVCLGEIKTENRQGKLQCVFNKIVIKK